MNRSTMLLRSLDAPPPVAHSANPRAVRALQTLLNGAITRKGLDCITGAANSPLLVLELHKLIGYADNLTDAGKAKARTLLAMWGYEVPQ